MSYYYAQDVFCGKRFLQGEMAIANDSHFAYHYAENIMKGVWPLGEAAIAKHKEYSYWYAMMVVKGQVSEVIEKAFSYDDEKWAGYKAMIACKTHGSSLYAKFGPVTMSKIAEKCGTNTNVELNSSKEKTVKGEYQVSDIVKELVKKKKSKGKPLVEVFAEEDSDSSIAENMTPQEAYDYAHDLIQGRWPAGEPVIAKSPKCSYLYAYKILECLYVPHIIIEGIHKSETYAKYYAAKLVGKTNFGEKSKLQYPKEVQEVIKASHEVGMQEAKNMNAAELESALFAINQEKESPQYADDPDDDADDEESIDLFEESIPELKPAKKVKKTQKSKESSAENQTGNGVIGRKLEF